MMNASQLEILKFVQLDEKDANEKLTNLVFVVGAILTSTGIIIALWGCCIKLTMNKCCLCMFTLVVFVVFVAFGLVSTVMVGQATQGRDYLEEKCSLLNDGKLGQMEELEQQVFKFVDDFDKKISESVNQNMCTI